MLFECDSRDTFDNAYPNAIEFLSMLCSKNKLASVGKAVPLGAIRTC